RDLLRADVLLDRDRVVGAALHRGVVGDDQHLAAGDAADAGDEAGAGRVVVVHLPRRQRRELEKRRTLVEEAVDALARRQLALLAMALQVARAAALTRLVDALAQLRDERRHLVVVGREVGAVSANAGGKSLHSPSVRR